MIRKDCLAIVALAVFAVFAVGCAKLQRSIEPDVVDVTLPVPADRVKAAVTKVLADDDYDVEWKDATRLQTGYRNEEPSIWNFMVVKGRYGVIRSKAEALVTPESEQSTHLRLQISSEGKQTMWDRWGATPPQVPQSAENKLRLIKNELKIVQTTYTTETFYGSKP